MRPHFLVASAFVLFASTAAAAAAAKDVFVRPGQAVRVMAVNQSKDGNSNSTTWVIVRDNGELAGVDVEPSMRAAASMTLRRPGRHHIVSDCGNHIATVASCTISTAP